MNFYKPVEECGIFGIFNHPEASNLTYLGLYALQHRGQESCGIVSSDGVDLHAHKSMGLVADVFGNEDVFKTLPGRAAIGHVRYSTTGSSVIKNVQPIMVDYSRGSIAVAHNGNLVNAQYIKDELEAWGSIFQTTMDTEIIVHLLAVSKANSLVERLSEALNRIKGAYCLLLLTETRMIAARDPHGFRPLCLGKLGSSYVVASESCALDLIEADFVREIEPGEIVVIDKNGLSSYFPLKKVEPAPCIFEFVYFARPDSYIFGKNVYQVRKELGRDPVRALVLPVGVVLIPDTNRAVSLAATEQPMGVWSLGDQSSSPTLILIVVTSPVEALVRAKGNGRVVGISELLNIWVHMPSVAPSPPAQQTSLASRFRPNLLPGSFPPTANVRPEPTTRCGL